MNNNTNINPNPTGQPITNNAVQQVVKPTQVPTNAPNTTLPLPEKIPKKSHKAGCFIFILLIIIGGLSYYIYNDYINDKKEECSPLIKSDNTTRQLDLNSTIVKDLYSKVSTSIKEDIASNDLDDQMKLYLAYRQIPESKIYESNCNLFNDTAMLPFTCVENVEFSPKAFKEETLQLELKKLFGESSNISNANIQLGTSCLGGYQYIADRGEYVQGYCKEIPTTLYNVEKKLIEATVTGDTITLKEKVRYYSAQKVTSDKLKNGTYVYTFKLDNNYNYVYTSRTIE